MAGPNLKKLLPGHHRAGEAGSGSASLPASGARRRFRAAGGAAGAFARGGDPDRTGRPSSAKSRCDGGDSRPRLDHRRPRAAACARRARARSQSAAIGGRHRGRRRRVRVSRPPPRQVRVVASKAGYVALEPNGADAVSPASARAMELAAQETRERVDLALARWAAVSGTIVNEAGAPLRGASVNCSGPVCPRPTSPGRRRTGGQPQRRPRTLSHLRRPARPITSSGCRRRRVYRGSSRLCACVLPWHGECCRGPVRAGRPFPGRERNRCLAVAHSNGAGCRSGDQRGRRANQPGQPDLDRQREIRRGRQRAKRRADHG